MNSKSFKSKAFNTQAYLHTVKIALEDGRCEIRFTYLQPKMICHEKIYKIAALATLSVLGRALRRHFLQLGHYGFEVGKRNTSRSFKFT
jgi:hypothetical protein